MSSGNRRPAELNLLISQYDGCIANIDSKIGNLLARLRELGLYENTLIVITSDHGEAMGEHDMIGHGAGYVYQDLVHVPLLVKYPGQHEAHQSDTLVSQVDLMPTILDRAGCAHPYGLQGRSFQLRDALGSDAVYAFATTPPGDLPRFREGHRAIFSESAKLIISTTGSRELYDLSSDPGEIRNEYTVDDPRANALADRLSGWFATIPRRIEQPPKMDTRSLERLKSLGYLQ